MATDDQDKVRASKRAQRALVKEKRRAILASGVDTVQWRERHSPMGNQPGVIYNAEIAPDVRGQVSHPHRVHDTLAALKRGDRITPLQYCAGRRFEDIAHSLASGTLKAAPLIRVTDSGIMQGVLPTEAAIHAQGQINKALQAVGGARSNMGQVTWLVLGTGQTLRATGESLVFLPSGKEGERAVKWLLIGSLDILANHFKL